MKAAFCIEAVEEALARHGRPETANTDQGSQFTSLDFTTALKKAQIAISMDGKGAWRDNVFAERLDTDDGGTIIQAEFHLARRPKLFRRTERVLLQFQPVPGLVIE
jgi:transposase InsO family protein